VTRSPAQVMAEPRQPGGNPCPRSKLGLLGPQQTARYPRARSDRQLPMSYTRDLPGGGGSCPPQKGRPQAYSPLRVLATRLRQCRRDALEEVDGLLSALTSTGMPPALHATC